MPFAGVFAKTFRKWERLHKNYSVCLELVNANCFYQSIVCYIVPGKQYHFELMIAAVKYGNELPFRLSSLRIRFFYLVAFTFIFIVVFFLLAANVAAQPKCKVEYYSTENGLSHQAV